MRRVAFCGWEDWDRRMGLMLNEDIGHLGRGREIGTRVGLVMIDAVGGNGNGLRGDRNRG